MTNLEKFEIKNGRGKGQNSLPFLFEDKIERLCFVPAGKNRTPERSLKEMMGLGHHKFVPLRVIRIYFRKSQRLRSKKRTGHGVVFPVIIF